MEHFVRRFYHWLPLSLKHKTALRKFVSVYLSRFIFRKSKAGFVTKEYFLGYPLNSINSEQLRGAITLHSKTFQQEHPGSPIVSIIIPVHNHIDFTVRCLQSIFRANTAAQYEIIVADDASSDGTQDVLRGIKSICYLRYDKNIGFIKTCNRAAQRAAGEYLIFLNNDTVVQDGWLDALFETFIDFPNAGLVGSKLIYPDGRLQEAGGVIWKDGTGRNYGWGNDPKKPEYNYLRETDFCSGASIMIPRALWEQLGGFDETFAPAYYEDVDLAFQVRKAGYKVYYQPVSEVIHYEGLSSGTDLDSGVKKYQEINRHTFFQKWKDVLSRHDDNSSIHDYRFRNRYTRARILYIDSTTPVPERDAGSIVAFQYMYSLRKLGCEVTFLPASDLGFANSHTENLQHKGIECLYHPYLKTADTFIRNKGKNFDIVILSRFTIASQYLETVIKHMPDAKIVFNTIDLHFLREERAAQIKNPKKTFTGIDDIKRHELSIIQKVSHTLVVSETEYTILHDLLPDAPVSVIPIPGQAYGSLQRYDTRREIVFIGGYNHIPNVDAVVYFVNEIWPLISSRLPGVRFLIAGSNMPADFSRFASENVILQGYVEDLANFFSHCRLSVAPLRFGSGVKGKIITSLGYGVPCVATSIATEGMGLVAGHHVLQADSQIDFADAVVEAYTNQKLWDELSVNGLEAVKEKYSISVVEERLAAMLNSLGIHES
jgi:O-antigen biosynthesis protein